MKCPNCGEKNPEGSSFCLKCGAKLVVENTCPNCGNELVEGADFCPSCGEPLSKITNVNTKKAKKQRSAGKKKTGAMQRLREKFNLPFNPIWLVFALLVILLVIAAYFLISYVPKSCRPLAEAIEGSEFEYGCNDELCYLWLQEVSEIPGFSLKYHWDDGGEVGLGECEPDTDSPTTLFCTFPADSSGGGVLITVGDNKCESTPLVYLEGDEIADLQEQSQLQKEAACKTFSESVNNLIQKTDFSYEYDPLAFSVRLGVLEQFDDIKVRYEWGNDAAGTVNCWLGPDNSHYCGIPSESSEKDLDVWILNGECEQHLQKFSASEVNWSDTVTCIPEFVDAVRATEGDFAFSCSEDACWVWISGISAYEDATIAYKLNGSQDLEPMDDCYWDDNFPDNLQLGCRFLFEEIPDRVAVYVDLDGCVIYVNTIFKEFIEESQASNQQ